MNEQTLFSGTPEPLPVNWSPWFGGGTALQRERVALGLHPMGERLANNGHICGDCGWLRVKSLAKTYLKCAAMPTTGGPGTDIRRRCEMWKETR